MSPRIPIRPRLLPLWLFAAAALLAGCGDKIAIPEADAPFSVNAYYEYGVSPDSNVAAIAEAGNQLYVLGDDGTLSIRFLNFALATDTVVTGLTGATALCTNDDETLIFVWLSQDTLVSVYNASDLSHLGDMEVSGVRSVVGMVTNNRGISVPEEDPLPDTFLYLGDADSLVVHRFAFHSATLSLEPKGILCRADGSSTRFVHQPAGMLKDRNGMMLVCDADPARNWVIRFDPSPALTDTATGDEAIDPWRGLSILYADSTCSPPAQADYTLGDAPICGQTDWVGAPSAEEGEFDAPCAVDQDGDGVIYVLDRGNDRVQMFGPAGDYIMQFGDVEKMPDPNGIAVVDWRISGSEINYGAYVFVVSAETGRIHRFISYDQFLDLNEGQPPEI